MTTEKRTALCSRGALLSKLYFRLKIKLNTLHTVNISAVAPQ